jgi:hypothetical protein
MLIYQLLARILNVSHPSPNFAFKPQNLAEVPVVPGTVRLLTEFGIGVS